MKRILITAINSFTGIHLKTYLIKQGFEVIGTTSETCDITNIQDIIDILIQTKPDYIIHLAGISFTAHSNNEDFYKVNTIGTINLLDVIIKLGLNPKKIILASSATVYGNQSLEILDESLCPKPSNHYGASKFAMESLATQYFSKLSIIITRPFNYTGIGQNESFLIPKIIKHFKENQNVIELGNLDVKREFNDVNFVCEAYYKLILSDEKSQILNIASQNPVALLDVIKIMNKIAGYKIKVNTNPSFIRKDEIKSLCGSKRKLEKLIGNIDNTDIEKLLLEMYLK